MKKQSFVILIFVIGVVFLLIGIAVQCNRLQQHEEASLPGIRGSDPIIVSTPLTPIGPDAASGKPIGSRSEAGPVCTIQTVDVDGSFLPYCTIHLESNAEWQFMGTTDESGRLEISSGSSGGVLHAAKDGFVPANSSLAAAVASEIQLILQPGWSVSGQLTDRDGFALDIEDVWVTAWPRKRVPSLATFEQVRLGHPILPATKTKRGGAFLLNGLQSDTEYELIAGGEGCCSLFPVVAVPDGPDLRLVVAPLFGAQCLFISQDVTQPSKLDPHLLASLGFAVRNVDYSNIDLFSPQVALAGVPATVLDQSKVSAHLFLGLGRTFTDGIGPLEVQYNFPGYRPSRSEFWLPRIQDSLQTVRIPLLPTGEALGSLAIIYAVSNESTRANLHRMSGIATIKLVSERNPETTFSIGVWDFANRVVEGIPIGRYRIDAHLLFGNAHLSETSGARYVDVTSSSSAKAEFDLRKSASLDIKLVDAAGAPYNGRAVIQVADPATGHVGRFGFLMGPYIIQCLPPGVYDISPDHLTSEAGRSSTSVSLSEGEVISLSFLAP